MAFAFYAILTLIVALATLAMAFVLFILFYRFPGKRFDSAGVPIFYSDHGSGTPVVLVHGLGVNGDLNWRWPRISLRLRKHGYRVVTMDARGHGNSGKPHEPEKYGVEMALDVLRLMDHLGIERAHIAGFSMGGFITLRLITLHPERFLSAAICASGWSKLDDGNRALMQEIIAGMEKRKLDPVVNWLDKNKHAPPLLCTVINFFAGLTNDFEAIVNLFKNFEGLEVPEAAMRANTVPTITIIGTNDGIGEYAQQTNAVMANHEIVYVEGGDHWNLPQLPGLYQNLRAHLDRHSPTPVKAS